MLVVFVCVFCLICAECVDFGRNYIYCAFSLFRLNSFVYYCFNKLNLMYA